MTLGPLAIHIPAYCAESTLSELVGRIPSDVWELSPRVLVVDDGSKDGTARLAAKLASQHPHFDVHSFPENRGYGAATAYGLAWARDLGAVASICLHADGQYPPEQIPDLLAALEKGCDLVQGSRHLHGTALRGGMPFYKWMGGKGLVAVERFGLGLPLTDFHSGFLGFGPRALAALPLEKMSQSFDFDLEAIARTHAAGLTIGEIGIPTRYADEVSHLRSIPYGLRCLRVVWRFRMGAFRTR